MGIIAGIVGAVSAVLSVAASITKALGVVGLAVEGLKVIGAAIMSIAKALGIIKPEREIDELGDRALQAEEKGMKPEGYDSYEAWVKDIEKDDWGYDPEKNKDMPVEDKIMKGLEVSSGVVVEKFPTAPIEQFIVSTAENSDFFTPERFEELGKLAATDKDAFEKIVCSMTGVEKNHEAVKDSVHTLMNVEKNMSGGQLSDNEAYKKVMSYMPQTK